MNPLNALKPVLDQILVDATMKINDDMRAFAFYSLLFSDVGEQNAESLKLPNGDPIPLPRLWAKGDARKVNHLTATYWEVFPDRYELTLGIDPDDYRRDQLGWMAGQVEQIAAQQRQHGPILAYNEIINAATVTGYDAQPLFSASHPVGTGTQSNMDNGGGSRTWFLANCNMPIKPFGDWLELVPQYTNLLSDPQTIHNQKELEWGVFTWRKMMPLYWPLAYACDQTLDQTYVEAAAAAMRARKNVSGNPMGIWPTHLFFDSRDRKAALEVCSANLIFSAASVGGTNVSVQLNLVPVEIPGLGDLTI